MTCQHKDFEASVNVIRIEDKKAFRADLEIRCVECETPMMFIGLPRGLSPNKPTVSFDMREIRMPITAANNACT